MATPTSAAASAKASLTPTGVLIKNGGTLVAGMVLAAFGYLAPVQGTLLQEAIDVAVILNALRALH